MHTSKRPDGVLGQGFGTRKLQSADEKGSHFDGLQLVSRRKKMGKASPLGNNHPEQVRPVSSSIHE